MTTPIWEYQPEECDLDNNTRNFGSKIKEMYELEYKWSMLQAKPFIGHPKRQNNILRKLESNLQQITEIIQSQLCVTLERWLDSHAILFPRKWADRCISDNANFALVEGDSLEREFDSMACLFLQYAKHLHTKYNKNDIKKEDRRNEVFLIMLDIALKSEYPFFMKFIRQECKNKKCFIEKANWNELFDGKMEEFCYCLEGELYKEDVLREFYEYQVFPEWKRYWLVMGIKETRIAVKDIYMGLKKESNSLGNLIALVNLGLNVAHQTGKMIEYLEEDTDSDNLRAILKDMSEGIFIDRVNKELQIIGVQI